MRDVLIYSRLGTTPDKRYARADSFFFLAVGFLRNLWFGYASVTDVGYQRGVSSFHFVGERLRKGVMFLGRGTVP